MKRVILSQSNETIVFEQLTGRELICYLSHKTNTPKLLVKLSQGRHYKGPDAWGFVSIAYPTGDIVFVGETFLEAAKKTLQSGRQLFSFDSYIELLSWLTRQPVMI